MMTWNCLDRISRIKWSPNSCIILCILESRNTCQLFIPEKKAWRGKLDLGNFARTDNVQFSPDSLSIIAGPDKLNRISIWSLTSTKLIVFSDVKNCSQALFCDPHSYQIIILTQSPNAPNEINIFDTQKFETIAKINTDYIIDSIHLMPDSGELIFLSHGEKKELTKYNLLQKQKLSYSFIDFNYKRQPKNIYFSNNHQFICVVCYDASLFCISKQTLRVLSVDYYNMENDDYIDSKLSPDSNLLAITTHGQSKSSLRIFDFNSITTIKVRDIENYCIESVNWFTDSNTLLLKTSSSMISWNKSDGISEISESYIDEIYRKVELDATDKKIIGTNEPKWFVTSIT
ncbi:MAG: WD repeat-containing protein wrap73, variant 2 [Marteilia pararefringens]